MKAKRFFMLALGALGVCFSITYAVILLGMVRAFGHANEWAVIRDLSLCAVVAILGALAIYQGVRRHPSPRTSARDAGINQRLRPS